MVREGLHIRQDGTTFPVWITTEIAQNEEGEPHAIVSTIEDITERKEMELALEQERASLARRVEERTAELREANEELEIASKLKDQFLESMTHELQDPLNVILGMAETLLHEVYGKLTGKQANAVESIESSGQNLLGIMNDILDISKIRAGTLQLKVAPVPVRPVFQSVLKVIRPLADKKHLTISARIDKKIQTLRTEAARLQQALIHLLNNAVKFTPDEGEVGVMAKGEKDARLVHFTVWDTGFGIEDEDIGSLFAPFVQGDEMVARIYGGTGLGLSLVYHIVELHLGCITVESDPERGSRFTLTLPWIEEALSDLVTPQMEEFKEAHKTKAGGSAPLILMADANGPHRHVVSDYLAAQGYRVVLTGDGEKTLRTVREHHPVLLLLDMRLPKLSGVEVIHQIRKNADTASLPILATTTIVAEEERNRCLEAGADEYLSHPFNLPVLVKRIDPLLQT